jgi:hypothetical protein
MVSDKLSEIPDLWLRPGVASDAILLDKPVSLTAARAGNDDTIVTLQPQGAARVVVTLNRGQAGPVTLKVADSTLTLRLSSREVDGILHIRVHDIHLVCS